MKRTALILSFVLALLLCPGCTQPNGHIGKLFGSWVLVEMTRDGVALDLPDSAEGITMSFQRDVVMFSLIYNPYDADRNLATWSRSEDLLTFNFNHHSDETAPGQGAFSAPSWLYMTGMEATFAITRLDGGHLDFVGDGIDGCAMSYRFERTW